MINRRISLTAPAVAGNELAYLADVLDSPKWAGGAAFTKRCEAELCTTLAIRHALLTPSCTAALEMCALLSDLSPGDEVIMPSFGFSSTANAVVLRGAVPVFVDVRGDTLNLDETKIAEALTTRTKAIVVIHYGGVCADMDAINAIARANSLCVIEDAAQAYLATYRGRYAGTLGTMGTFSFHETKNIGCGEGGAFVTSDAETMIRAEIIREKGTDRSRFLRGEIDKYSWVATGSSYLPSEFQAAVLLAQLEKAAEITARRIALWNGYQERLGDLELQGYFELPWVPEECGHNAHIYRLMLPDKARRDTLMAALQAEGIGATFHFVPLHDSEEGLRRTRAVGTLPVTTSAWGRLLRLPINDRLTSDDVELICDRVRAFVKS